MVLCRSVAADPWAAPGDVRLRHDLQLLADSGIVQAPLTSWPVSWGEIARDVSSAGDGAELPAHVAAALVRVRAEVADVSRSGILHAHARMAGSADPMALRRFGDVPREEGEFEAGVQYTGDWFAVRLQTAAVADAHDGQTIRPDGSYIGAALGNWMVSAGYVDKWWGPGWEGSLILSSNARPMPALTIERNYSDPFDHPWLGWIGRWRLNFTFGQLEGDRQDAPDARFFASRLTWKPHPRVEVGISRSAQWCGDGRPCGAGTFWDLLTGNDNDQPLAEQPGNQLAGFDVRWSLPGLPVAFYAQAIGEDEAGFMPSKYLGLVGAEAWGGWGGRSWRLHVEYADTACNFTRSPPEYGCAYLNGIYLDGYQYRDRSIGHALDGDSEQLAFGAVLVNADGSSWELAAQDARVNRASANPVHSVTPVAAKIRSADVYHRRILFGGDLMVGAGYEQRDAVVPAGGFQRSARVRRMGEAVLVNIHFDTRPVTIRASGTDRAPRMWRLLAAALLGLASVSVAAQTPTPEQMAIFKSLPPEAQKQLLEQVMEEQGQASTEKPPAEDKPGPAPAPQAKDDDFNLRIRPRIEGDIVLRAGDSLLVQLAIPEPKLGQPPLKEEESERLQDLADRAARGNPYRLTRQGALELPGLAPIPLAGLIVEEATLRLNLDTALRGLVAKMTYLPLDAQGTDALKPFGYDLFRDGAGRMTPAMNVPVPAEYAVGPGDVLEVQTYGKEAGRYSLEVGRDGRIDFPELGPIAVAGQRFEAVRGLIERRVREQLIGVEVSVSMGELSGIQVYVLGDAERPGSYTVSSLSTITNALLESGGVKPIGSLRDIQLKRNGVTVRRLDLYDVLLNGDTSGDMRLLPGDVIFVPPVGRTVSVEGEVRRPAIYEIKGDGSAADLLYLSGGLVPEADPRLARLTRIDGTRQRTVIDLDLTSPLDRATKLETGDVMRVFPIRPTLENSVAVEGHVFRPGASQYRPGLRLSGVIGSADELRPNADLGYVLIRRETGPGRIVEVLSADLGAALRAPGTDADPLLQPRDRLIVFDREGGRERVVEPILLDLQRQGTPDAPVQVVSVFGTVKAPGRYPLEPAMTVADLVRAGGGLGDAAYQARAELTRMRVGEGDRRATEVIQIDLAAALRGDPTENVRLSPYDYLSIKQVPEWGEQGVVQVRGEVRFPGRYPIKRGETLKSVIERAGGLTSLAFAEGSVFLRENLRERERQQLKTLADRLQADLATLALQSSQVGGASQGSQALIIGQQLMTQLQTTEPVGRLVIDLPRVLAAEKGAVSDVVLRGGDELMIPKQSQEVTVLGEVQNATSHFYREGIGQNEYISLSGGLTARADKGRIYVVRANGSVVANESSRWFGRGATNIQPGDTVVVPLEADRIRPLTLWTSVTQILYNVAVAVAAVNSF